MIRIRTAAMAGLVVFATTPAAFADPVLYDPSFEKPSVPAGTFVNFDLGDAIYSNAGGDIWVVVGPAMTQVSLFGCPYVESGFTYNAAAGHNFVDLTGDGANVFQGGVAQNVETIPGDNYKVKFSVGNILGTSTVILQINGSNVFSGTNNIQSGTTTNWHHFSYIFTASSSVTSIGFLNGDAADDHFNGLDVAKLTHL